MAFVTYQNTICDEVCDVLFKEPLEMTQEILENPNILFQRFENARLELNKKHQVKKDADDQTQYVHEIQRQRALASASQKKASNSGFQVVPDYDELDDEDAYDTDFDHLS